MSVSGNSQIRLLIYDEMLLELITGIKNKTKDRIHIK